MKRLSLGHPAVDYDDNLTEIDEQICALVRQRKDVSHNKQTFPTEELVAKWSARYGLYEEYIKSLFMIMMDDEHFKPMVEPAGFIRHIQILQAIEQGDYLFSLNSMKQYSNASVIVINIDWEGPEDQHFDHEKMIHVKLSIGEDYDCRMINGSSNSDHAAYRFVVSPPLPDDLTGIELRFTKNWGVIHRNCR
ncbi:hypothetical protein [Paenibacillus piscarius]|uniref:hypothetical protein n=1 Tax=Paenibacillus piscarius TaxID=1089681 RepID=UPI001EE91C93|nr:hypothetical protein [Paenibacillus piscarius]